MKAIIEWDLEISNYQNRLTNQERVGKINPVEYINSLMEILKKHKEKTANFEQAKAELEVEQGRLDRTGFDDWSR